METKKEKGRRRYVRIADSVGIEPWSNDVLATFVRLAAHMNTRWARDGLTAEAAASVAICKADLMRITGKHRADVALKSARCLADVASISVERRGDVTLICWPKFAQFQGYGPQIAGNIPASRPASRARDPRPAYPPTPHPGDAQSSGPEPEIPNQDLVRRVDWFIRALAVAERDAGFEPTRADSSVNRKRLARIFALVGEIGDDAIWATRVSNAVATRKAKGNGDCAWIWMGDDERAALRIDQLASGPVWGAAKEAEAFDSDAWVRAKEAEEDSSR